MQEYSRILIERYCEGHHSQKSRRLQKLVDMSYDMGAEGTDADAVFLDRFIKQEPDDVLRDALEDLYEFLFAW